MSHAFGISGAGRQAEDLFLSITGARSSSKASEGDAELDGHLIEVKGATGTTLNQVRAVKYIPLVVFLQPRDEWYVVPAHVVVAQVSQKTRGQHTENPFESATLNLDNLQRFRVDRANLRQETLNAVESSKRFPQLRNAMETVLAESRRSAAEAVQQVRALLHELGLG